VLVAHGAAATACWSAWAIICLPGSALPKVVDNVQRQLMTQLPQLVGQPSRWLLTAQLAVMKKMSGIINRKNSLFIKQTKVNLTKQCYFSLNCAIADKLPYDVTEAYRV
jgi:hypothetical protein